MVNFYVILAFALAFHSFFGVLLSKEVLFWPKLSILKRTLMLFSIWFIPVIGAIYSYKVVKLNWFRKPSSHNSASGSSLLDLDSIFNPGAKYYIEAKQEGRIERKEKEREREKIQENKKT